MHPLSLPEVISEQSNQKLKQEFSKRLCERLRDVRKNKGFTQEQLAAKAGLHEAYLGHLELGKYHPTAFVLWKISKALDVSMDELTSV